MAVAPSPVRRALRTIGNLRTGIVLLIIVGIVSAIGTIILQRPLTEPQDMERAYSPETLRILDALGLTDVFHAWWFALLLGTLGLSIVLVSIDRFPNAWRFYSRPYRRTEPHFRAGLPNKKQVPIADAAAGLNAAERAMRKIGLNPERIVDNEEVSLFAEKARFSVMAVYVVHFSLLLIFLGGIIDAVWGYKGYIQMIPGDPATTQIELQSGGVKHLPFAVRCDGAGQENYTGQFAGMPKKWWSSLVVLEDGREVLKKQVEVNEPLVYGGIRFFQSGFGQSNKVEGLTLAVGSKESGEDIRQITLAINKPAALDDNTSVQLTRFISDAYKQENGEVFRRSYSMANPAFQLQLASKDGKTSSMWLFPAVERITRAEGTPYVFMVTDLKLSNFTGLQVSYEPGQWAVWAGCVLMGVGLIIAFYMIHTRYWVTTITGNEGKLWLWMGAAANKNRESFEQRFQQFTEAVEGELKAEPNSQTEELATADR